MIATIFTIGYSGFQPGDFLRALQRNRVSTVIDVRTSPVASAYFAHYYSGEALSRFLNRNGIRYHSFGDAFGGRSENRELYNEDGYLDYERVAGSKPFLEGVERLMEGMRQGYTFALLCAEKHPLSCHRAILVSRAFHERGCKVIHLLPEGESLTQEELNELLLELYYPNRNQLSLFEVPKSDRSLLAEAYRRRNAEIGYRLPDIKQKGLES